MFEEIMRVKSLDVVDNDHGSSSIELVLEGLSGVQSFIVAVNGDIGYKLLTLLNIASFKRASGQPIIALREEAYGYIHGIKRLPCDAPMELIP